jgi:hypothetical protein
MNGTKWRVSQVPPGSSQVVACMKRSEKMNRFSTVGTFNSGGPEAAPASVERRSKAIDDQPKEGVNRSFRESDPPIVVRDGNAGHKAKEWAGGNASKALTKGHDYSLPKVSSSLLAMEASSGTLCWNWFQVRAS